jgi:hemolysin III
MCHRDLQAFTLSMATPRIDSSKPLWQADGWRGLPTDKLRDQSAVEERANAWSHGLALALALAAWPWLITAGHDRGGVLGAFGAAVFCGSMAFQYLASCVYHALPNDKEYGRAKLWARGVDHAAIYLFIAGSATPFMLAALEGMVGLLSCAVIWTIALAGAWLKLTRRLTNRRWSTGLYVLLGWFAFLSLSPSLWHIDTQALALILAGGGAYMLGTVFFLYDHALRFGHLVWHVFAIAGSCCHVAAALSPALF